MRSDSTIKALRVAAGFTQKGLAEAAGLNIRQLQKLEAGEILAGNLTLRNALGLADALGVDVRDLLTGSATEASPQNPPGCQNTQKSPL